LVRARCGDPKAERGVGLLERARKVVGWPHQPPLETFYSVRLQLGQSVRAHVIESNDQHERQRKGGGRVATPLGSLDEPVAAALLASRATSAACLELIVTRRQPRGLCKDATLERRERRNFEGVVSNHAIVLSGMQVF
jgi:hypothetical protein